MSAFRRVSRATAALGIACLAYSPGAGGQVAYPGARWDTLGPGARWNPDSLRAIGAYVAALGSGAVVVVDDGRLVAQWGEPARKFPLASVRKSLVSSLIGIEVQRGHIALDATLAALGIDDDPPLRLEERGARVVDLLGARSGVYHPAAHEPAGMKRRRPAHGSAKPGERWFYNNWDFNALGTIFERATRRSIFDAFATDIAVPTGMQDYQPTDGEYVHDATSQHAAYTFRMTARDVARYMLLWMRGGRWGDQQILPAEWIARSTTAISDAGEDGSYGLLWWVERDGQLVPGARLDRGAFAARGNGPHYAIAIPTRKLIIVHLANTAAPSPANWVERGDVGRLVERILDAQPRP
jgi:CubicO group peptidase (beta-lactamase class C family)